MRKLKLQVQMSVDGFVAGPNGELDWTTRDMDQGVLDTIIRITDSSDTILLGHGMTEGFINYWEAVPADSPEYHFAVRMVSMKKIVFSTKTKHVEGKNVSVENGDLVEAVNRLKNQPGKDIVVYGGATFVRNLIARKLIDELNIFVNPVAIGEGLRIFSRRTPLTLLASTGYPSGIVINSYAPA
jgi:dihydrofolate reductase